MRDYLASKVTYLVASGLVVLDGLGELILWLDGHAGSAGFGLGVLTYLTNLYFKAKYKTQ